MRRKSLKKTQIAHNLSTEELDILIAIRVNQAERSIYGPPRTSPAPMNPKEIAELRKGFHLSQADFASILNVSVQTVQGWEQGVRVPGGVALKLLYVISRNRKILLELL